MVVAGGRIISRIPLYVSGSLSSNSSLFWPPQHVRLSCTELATTVPSALWRPRGAHHVRAPLRYHWYRLEVWNIADGLTFSFKGDI